MAAPESAFAKSNGTQDWDSLMHSDLLKREDIYRQRVFGNNSGAKQFIQLEERRKVKPQWLLLYLIFLWATWTYTFDRLTIEAEFDVYEAIRTPFETTVFRSNPQTERWKDIDNMEDVKEWLLNAFPDIMTPDVQHFNIPLGQIRFTMRRMLMENNTDERFNDYYSLLWTNSDGIANDLKSSEFDDKEAFGAYRVWSNVSLDWTWPSKENKKCPSDSTWIDVVHFSDYMSDDELTINCRQWCEQLIRPLTCHCFEQSLANARCNFYQVKIGPWNEATKSLGSFEKPPGHSDGKTTTDGSLIVPRVENGPGLRVWFPVMKQFLHQDNKGGYKKTPGYVQLLTYYNQEDLLALSKAKGLTPEPPQRVMSGEIEDWFAGGFVGKHSVTLSVDFATFNPNYDMFSWVQLQFRSTATGYVNKKLHIQSIKIVKSATLENKWAIGDEFASIWDVIYLVLVGFYVACEVWEMTCCAKGLKYFVSLWNWLTVLHLLLNVLTIILWLAYKGQTDFVNELIAMQSVDDAIFSTANLASFATQVEAYRNFKIFAAFNMLFLALQLLQYLNDICPRVTVLIEAATDAFVPIFFFTVVCVVIIFGTIMWTYIWFGRSLEAFSSFPKTVVTVVAMTVGEFSSFGKLREVIGVEMILFYMPYQLFMIAVILNFPRAVLNAGYADASLKHENEMEKEAEHRNAKQANSGDGPLRKLKAIQVTLQNYWPDGLSSAVLVKKIKQHKSMTFKHKKINFAVYIVFTIFYTVMCIMIMGTSKASNITKMVDHAVKEPTFIKSNSITGNAIRGSNFASINTRDDVNDFISQVLPEAMFMTSGGVFDGKENLLLNYSSAPAYKQLVLSHWNILVGQKPVRMTVKLSKMRQLGNDAIRGVVPTTYYVRARETLEPGPQTKVSPKTGLPDSIFMPEKSLTGIMPNRSRDIIDKYCNYSFGYGTKVYDDLNGFVCMLSIDSTITRPQLQEMARGLLTAQTVTLTIETVLYNAFAETFGYVSIRFGFQPNGLIWKDVEVEPVSLQLHTGIAGTFLLILEILVLILNSFYFFTNIWELLKAMKKGWNETDKPEEGHASKEQGTRKKLTLMVREMILFYTMDMFNGIDLVSCIATYATMIMFYGFMGSALGTQYFFQEAPTWDQGKCTSANFEWCSDTEVITQFFTAKETFRTFTRVCAINTIAIYMRMLRYVKTFENMRVIFSTLFRGLVDIMWFVVVFVVLLLGYMFLGFIVFGANSGDFRDTWSSTRACFEIFLGTFNEAEMADASLAIMIVYVFTFWFVFKLIVVNMFLAIIDKHYNELDKERLEQDVIMAEVRRNEIKQPSKISLIMAQVKNLFKGAPEKNEAEEGEKAKAKEEEDAKAEAKKVGDAGDAGTGAAVSSPRAPADTGGAPAEPEAQESAGAAAAVAIEDEESAPKACEKGCGFQKTWHDSQCCIACTGPGGVHGKRCDKLPMPADRRGLEEKTHAKENVKNANWQQLPEEVQDWSLKTASWVTNFLEGLIQTRESMKAQQPHGRQANSMEHCLEEAETRIGDMKKEWGDQARCEKETLDNKELAELRKVHQDQESLSWYIMKRDAELKKLESAKELKQDRFDKMVKAANSLIKPDEDAQGGDQLQVMNR